MFPHITDTDCKTLDINRRCVECGVRHGERPCPSCGAHAICTLDCNEYWKEIPRAERTVMWFAVTQGVKLMDEQWPTWKPELRQQIEKHPLDMADCSRCVGGRLFSDYPPFLERLFPTLSRDERYDKGAEYGFAVPLRIEANKEHWDYLGLLWTHAVK